MAISSLGLAYGHIAGAIVSGRRAFVVTLIAKALRCLGCGPYYMERSGSMIYLQDSIGHVENVGSQCHPLQQVSATWEAFALIPVQGLAVVRSDFPVHACRELSCRTLSLRDILR